MVRGALRRLVTLPREQLEANSSLVSTAVARDVTPDATRSPLPLPRPPLVARSDVKQRHVTLRHEMTRHPLTIDENDVDDGEENNIVSRPRKKAPMRRYYAAITTKRFATTSIDGKRTSGNYFAH